MDNLVRFGNKTEDGTRYKNVEGGKMRIRVKKNDLDQLGKNLLKGLRQDKEGI